MTLNEVFGSSDESRDSIQFTGIFGAPTPQSSYEQDLTESSGPTDEDDSRKDAPALGSVWRDYLAQSRIAAAIIHCDTLDADGAALSFFVGFDGLRKRPGMTSDLLSFAKHVWGRSDPSDDEAAKGCAADASARAGSACLLPAELADFTYVAALHHRTGDYQVHAIFFREQAAGDFTPELLATLKLTLPLFLCSASRQTALVRMQQQTSMFKGMIDWLNLGMLMLDERGHLVTSNVAGDALFAGERLLRLASDGSVVCRRPAETKALRSAIEQVCRSGSGSRAEVVVKLGETEDRWRLGFVLSAAPEEDIGGKGHALLLVLPCRPATASRQMLDVLGLLPSEQRFLLSFLDANSLSEGAARAGVSDETAKTYLKRIRCKLGVHRQIELAQLIYGQSPPLRTRSDLITGQTSETSHALL